ncbi:MAG: 16S rRNA (cytosine(1402)-N(4))-methyltransferase RsmH [Gammaproteobacteria bacterium]
MMVEALEGLAVRPSGCYLDATFGGGGHSKGILAQLDAEGSLRGLDRDAGMIEQGELLAQQDSRLALCHGSFSQMADLFQPNSFDGILMDLGISSIQLDDEQRGFSFHAEAPLDMRMDQGQQVTAENWLAQATETQMEQVFKQYGNERHAQRIAEAIASSRDLSSVPLTAAGLSALIGRVKPGRDGRKHPATRVFQALRLVVNNEIEELQRGLELSEGLLKEGGRLVVIAFHSLEDSLVSRFIRQSSMLFSASSVQKPTFAEKRSNPRSRSALLRVAHKKMSGELL